MRLARSVAVGEPGAVLLHVTEENEGDVLPHLRALTDAGFVYVALEAEDWNGELSPWPAPPVFGKIPFSGRARDTLNRLLTDILPQFDPALPRIVGGYSLAGLFALWVHYETDAFEGAVAASPSVWYPDWDAYADAHSPHGVAYLSLGDREPRTRNRQMAVVGDAIQRQSERFRDIPSILEWNAGNHFTDPELRTAKGFHWAMDAVTKKSEPA